MRSTRLLLLLGLVIPALVVSSSGAGISALTNGPIVFESTRAGSGDIYVTTDGKTVRRLTTDPGYDATPSWSPDGREIVFASDRRGEWRLFRMTAAGERQRELVVSAPRPFAPRWSPNGELIAFQSFADNGIATVYVVAADGGGVRRISPAGVDDTSPSWSPDSNRLVVSRGIRGRYGLYVIDVRTPGSARALTKSATDFEPDWSPAGDRVAFSRLDTSGNYDVFTMPARAGARPLRLTTHPAEDGGPAWSPDGSMILYRSARAGIYSLWTVGIKDRRSRLFVQPGRGIDVAGDWVPKPAAALRTPAGLAVSQRASAFFCSLAYTGTSGNDTIDGTIGINYMCGKAGADKIRGLAGSDQIDGGSGNDKFFVGGVLGDGLIAGSGNDVVYARALSAPTGDCDFVDGGDGASDSAWLDKAAVPCGGGVSSKDIWTRVETPRPP